MGWTHSWNCEFEKALGYLNRSLQLSTLANNPIGKSVTKGVSSAGNYTFSGKVDLAYETSKELIRTADESDDTFLKGMAYVAHGSCCYFKGLFDEAEDYLLRGSALCEKTAQYGWKAWAGFFLGSAYLELDEYVKAREYYEREIDTLESVKMLPSFRNMAKVALARAEVLYGNQWVNVSELSNELRKCYEQNKLRVFEGWMARYIGEILLHIDNQNVTNPEACIQTAMEADKRNGTIWHLSHDYITYAKFLKRKGDNSKAIENLGKALEILEECGAEGWTNKFEKELASFS